MSQVTAPRTLPSSPSSLAALGIAESIVEDILLQRLVLDGRSSVTQLAKACALSIAVVDGVVDAMRQRILLEIQGMDGRDYVLVPTEKGKQEAASRARTMSYTGPVPVSLEDYTAMVLSQQVRPEITAPTLRMAFNDLVISDELFSRLGPALVSDGALFLYGPPGTGKTSLVERLPKMYADSVLIPRAVEAQRQLVMVFDPALHEPVVPQPDNLDARWVLCERPCIIVGGELTTNQLELQADAHTGVSLGPLQMRANNGILVVDDFGRQRVTPDVVLNRWIVPMSRGVDFLNLSGGANITNPFDVKLVFSTNMRPEQLGDDAFLRRIPNKVFVGPITPHAFDQILASVCRGFGIACNQDAADYMKKTVIERSGMELRPYYPADFAKTLRSICAFEGEPMIFSVASIDKVAETYFTRDDTGIWATAVNTLAA